MECRKLQELFYWCFERLAYFRANLRTISKTLVDCTSVIKLVSYTFPKIVCQPSKVETMFITLPAKFTISYLLVLDLTCNGSLIQTLLGYVK